MNNNSGTIKFSDSRIVILNYGNQFFSKSDDLQKLYSECYRNDDSKIMLTNLPIIYGEA